MVFTSSSKKTRKPAWLTPNKFVDTCGQSTTSNVNILNTERDQPSFSKSWTNNQNSDTGLQISSTYSLLLYVCYLAHFVHFDLYRKQMQNLCEYHLEMHSSTEINICFCIHSTRVQVPLHLHYFWFPLCFQFHILCGNLSSRPCSNTTQAIHWIVTTITVISYPSKFVKDQMVFWIQEEMIKNKWKQQ